MFIVRVIIVRFINMVVVAGSVVICSGGYDDSDHEGEHEEEEAVQPIEIV